MSTALTKFECFPPVITQGTICNTFLDTLGSICGSFVFSEVNFQSSSSTSIGQTGMVFGLLTSAQATSALAALNTMNASLVAAGAPAALCYTYSVTTQP
jgi:hypothetical protein